MPITSSLKPADIRKMINERIERKKQALYVRLFYIAEQCLNNARENHKYKVQTGNLTSSINYCIIDNGEIIKAGEWKATPGTENGKEGIDKGMEYLREMAEAQPHDGITFLMVAGMPYAKYVEAMSLDVLESSEEMAEKKVKEMIQKLLKE
ncbi:MAG: hypothetical protein ACOCN9_01820 [Prevotella sp.]|mgnify:FL=1